MQLYSRLLISSLLFGCVTHLMAMENLSQDDRTQLTTHISAISDVRQYPYKARAMVGEDHKIKVRPNPNKDAGEMSGEEYTNLLLNRAIISEIKKIGTILTKNGIAVPQDKTDQWLDTIRSQLQNQDA